jgi:hypothetical protein
LGPSSAGSRRKPHTCRASGPGAAGFPIFLLLALISCGGEGSHAVEGAPVVPAGHGVITVEDAGLEAPQSILYDSVGDLYLVSNSPGSPSDRYETGFIARLRPRGSVEDLRWIEGGKSGARLNAPKGMALRGDTLYVADLECVRLFHRRTGAPGGALCLSEGANLTDVTVDADGVVYATGTAAGVAAAVSPIPVVFKVELDGTWKAVLRGEEIGVPTGIAASPRGVFFTDLEGGTVAQLTPAGPRRVLRGRGWSLQGIVFLPDGSFAFSNRADSTVIYVRAKYGGSRGEVFTLVREVDSPGDLGYDARRGRILIPQASLNRLIFVDILP